MAMKPKMRDDPDTVPAQKSSLLADRTVASAVTATPSHEGNQIFAAISSRVDGKYNEGGESTLWPQADLHPNPGDPKMAQSLSSFGLADGYDGIPWQVHALAHA